MIRFGFCDIQNNRGLGKGYQPQPSASADNPYLDLDYSGYHKNLIQQLFIIGRIKIDGMAVFTPETDNPSRRIFRLLHFPSWYIRFHTRDGLSV